MKTFRQYYFEQKYWIWQTVFLMFFIAVTIAAIRSGEWETIIAVVLAAAINIGWYYRAKGIYNRLVRLGHELIAPVGAEWFFSEVFYKSVDQDAYRFKDGEWQLCVYIDTEFILNKPKLFKPIHRSKTPKV